MSVTAHAPITGNDHWAPKGGVKLFLYEKHAGAPGHKPAVLFVHGSSMSGQATFDMQMPGRPYASAMDYFVDKGFDAWCIDLEGYGRSDKNRDINFDILNGVDDLVAATDYITQTRGTQKFMLYGNSAGAIRAALFTQRHPQRVARLALDAFVWTGDGSPTLAERKRKLPDFLNLNRRPIDRAFLLPFSIAIIPAAPNSPSSTPLRARCWRSTIPCRPARISTCAQSCRWWIPPKSRLPPSSCAASWTASRA